MAGRVTDGGLLRPLLRLALPNIAATLIQAAMSFIEAWRLGALGSVSLAAVALVFPLFVLSNMWSAGAIGGAVRARARGAGDSRGGRRVARGSVIGVVGGAVKVGQWSLCGAPVRPGRRPGCRRRCRLRSDPVRKHTFGCSI